MYRVIFNCRYSEPPVSRSKNWNTTRLGKRSNDAMRKTFCGRNLVENTDDIKNIALL